MELEKKIIASAEKEAREIIRKAEEEADRIIKEAKKKAKKFMEKAREEAEKEAELIIKTAEVRARAEARRERARILKRLFEELKQEVISRVNRKRLLETLEKIRSREGGEIKGMELLLGKVAVIAEPREVVEEYFSEHIDKIRKVMGA